MYTRTFRPGEYVRIGDSEGTVVALGTFTTRLRTGMGEELTLPNSMVLGTVTSNYSRAVHGAGFIVDTTVTIGYDTPWRQVDAMLDRGRGAHAGRARRSRRRACSRPRCPISTSSTGSSAATPAEPRAARSTC